MGKRKKRLRFAGGIRGQLVKGGLIPGTTPGERNDWVLKQIAEIEARQAKLLPGETDKLRYGIL